MQFLRNQCPARLIGKSWAIEWLSYNEFTRLLLVVWGVCENRAENLDKLGERIITKNKFTKFYDRFGIV